MKSLFTSLLLMVIGFAVFAQTPIVKTGFDGGPIDNSKIIKATEWPIYQQDYREDIQSHWYSFTSALDFYNGGTMQYYTNLIFPDSQLVRISEDQNGDPVKAHVKWHSIGMAFDPTGDEYSFFDPDNSPTLLKRQPYTLDSIGFRYLYEKYNDNAIKDKLVIQFYNSTKPKRYVWTTTQEPWSTVEFDTNTLSGLDFTQEIIYDLEYKDTATWESGRYKWLSFPVNMSIPHPPGTMPRTDIVVTVTFKPGYSYKFRDTLSNTAGLAPYKKLNNFWHQMFYDPNGQTTSLNTYNNGLLMNYETRYKKLTGGIAALNGMYLPGNAFGMDYYPYMIFKITFDKDWIESINDINGNFKVGRVYPNPAKGNANLVLSLDNTSKVKIDILNNLGQVVLSVPATEFNNGEQNLSINTNTLNPGMYMIRVTINDIPSTQSLIVE